ncbi:uncharacterized protein LOC128861373 [Anastrepha ludens]|uniref:uncharacterized protein LOC128861373 n=1 Tax=Anastrepha ludens TaxID=28586 RepID=UPI0023AF2D82|nr:uncharacterized protein LOC128861373 [Anastrepha ludens]
MSKKPNIFRTSFTEQFVYKQHKTALNKISSAVDVGPPSIRNDAYLNLRGMRQDKFALKRIIKDNIKLLERINRIRRTHGLSDNYNTRKAVAQTKVHHLVRRVESIESQNQLFGCKLLKAKPVLTSASLPDSLRSSRTVLEKWNIRENQLMEQLVHPKIYLDLEVKNIRPLGRIIIQLYTEACPEMVLEFARTVSENKCHLLNFIRIFPGLWIEGEIYVNNRTLSRPNFEHDMTLLRHDSGSGILSFAKCYLNEGFPYGLLNFTASFKPMPILNGERVAFGELVAGHRVLDCVQDYGTKNGKVQKEIVVVHSGLKPY